MGRYLSPTRVPSCPLGLRILAFRPLTGKLQNISLSVLCGSAVKTTHPFRVNIKPPVLQVVVDCNIISYYEQRKVIKWRRL
jgi:hypothetical protein